LATNVQDATPTPTTSIIGLGYGENITFTRGKKFFELTNHLGNVLATVSDRKIGVSLDSSRISSYNPVINSAQEYYPFGMLMPGRGGHIATGRNFSGSTVVMYGDTIPATLTVTQRSNNTPGTYMATQTISFEEEFASGTADEFTTLFVDQTSADPGTESGISYGVVTKGYRYGFNGKENDNEVKGEGNEQDYGMRIYDPGLGRFLSIDPLTKNYPWYTPYQFAGNTPLQAVDMDGGEPKLVVKQAVTYSVENITLNPELDEPNKRPQTASVVVKKIDYSFTEAAAHLLSLVSGIDEANIRAIRIVNSVGSLFPSYPERDGGGAITIKQDGQNTIRMTDNYFSNPGHSWGETDYSNNVNAWFGLTSHEVGHLRDIGEIGGGALGYIATFAKDYISAGSHDGLWREQRADKGANEFRNFRQFVNEKYGVGKLRDLFENPNNSDAIIIRRVDQWWKQYQKYENNRKTNQINYIKKIDQWWNILGTRQKKQKKAQEKSGG
jgi:RHS repeat-associated protein